jgi:polyribonucleotide nucleotidyltransferase
VLIIIKEISVNLEFNVKIGKEEIKFSTGYLAKQADGSVLVGYGETLVFASVVADRSVREGQDFFPLTVDYREKVYAAGKIPGGFIKRESRPSDREILVCRLTDRPLRPLFPDGFINEVQVIIYVLSHDKQNQPDVLAINAASAALSISGIPFRGPVGAVRVGRVNGNWIVNPTFEEVAKSDIDLVVAGTEKAVTMIEGSSKCVSEEEMLHAVEFAHENIKTICAAQKEFAKNNSKPEIEYTVFTENEELKSAIRKDYYSDIEALNEVTDKKDREKAFAKIVERAADSFKDSFEDYMGQVHGIVDGFDGEIIRRRILEQSVRADGRGLKDIRPIDIVAGILPRAHG